MVGDTVVCGTAIAVTDDGDASFRGAAVTVDATVVGGTVDEVDELVVAVVVVGAGATAGGGGVVVVVVVVVVVEVVVVVVVGLSDTSVPVTCMLK